VYYKLVLTKEEDREREQGGKRATISIESEELSSKTRRVESDEKVPSRCHGGHSFAHKPVEGSEYHQSVA